MSSQNRSDDLPHRSSLSSNRPDGSTMLVSLNRLHITGPITKHTPGCVIFQIAQSLGLRIREESFTDEEYLKAVITSIQESRETMIVPRTNASPEQNTFIARFVNGTNIQWRIGPLMTAFEHLLTYYDAQKPTLPPEDFAVGYKNMSQPLAYDPCMMYRICRYNGITTFRSMTLEEMAYAVRLLTQDPELLRNRIADMIRFMPQNQLVSISLNPDFRVTASPNIRIKAEDRSRPFQSVPGKKHPPSIAPQSIDASRLTSTYTRLTDINRVLGRISAHNHEEAIILGAMVYGINLVDCVNPCAEYQEMQRISAYTSENRYIPCYDSLFRIKYLCNPMWYDVRRTWEPKLPSLYTQDQIETFAQAEGFQADSEIAQFEASQTFLQMSRVTPSFYIGIHPSLMSLDEQKVPLQTVITGENPFVYGQARIISFGTVESGTFDIYTVEELTSAFRTNLSFKNPTHPLEEFPPSSIRKLKRFCQEFIGSSESSETTLRSQVREFITHLAQIGGITGKNEAIPVQETELVNEYKALRSSIQAIEERNLTTSEQSRRLREYYQSPINPRLKTQITAYLTAILHLGYYMRGWMVRKNDPKIPLDVIPLASIQTQHNHEFHGQVLLNVTGAMTNINETLNRVDSEIHDFLRDLPLMKRCNGGIRGITFVASSDASDGFTILDRMAICRDGTSIVACIRMSSNHFLASAYYYMVGIGMDPPFNIEEMADIS